MRWNANHDCMALKSGFCFFFFFSLSAYIALYLFNTHIDYQGDFVFRSLREEMDVTVHYIVTEQQSFRYPSSKTCVIYTAGDFPSP